MSSTTGKLVFLCKVSYSGEHREIVAEFENNEGKRIQRQKFFPKAFFKAENEREEQIIHEILSLYDRKRFALSKTEHNIIQIQAATFTDLKKISNLLQKSVKKSLELIEPERQFLIEKEWNYFQAFKETKLGFEPAHDIFFPNAKIEGCSESIENTAKMLLKHDRKEALAFIEDLALSRILKIQARLVPACSTEESSIKFLQNCLFKNKFSIKKNNSPKPATQENNAFGFFENVSEIDFTPVWVELLSSKKYNLGFETINCDCCIPKSIDSENILPNSKVFAEFLQNGFYFESSNPEFALEFHNSNSNKQARVKRMTEWFLKTIPSGPFNSGEKALIPISDALVLEKAGKARVLKEKTELKWHCLKRESFIANKIETLILEITRLEDKLLAWEQSALSTHKVLCASQLSESPEYLFYHSLKKNLETILRQVLKELNKESSRFYDIKFATALKALQFKKISEFKRLAKANGEKILSSNPESMLVKAEKPSSLLKEFAKQSRTAAPVISKNYRQIIIS